MIYFTKFIKLIIFVWPMGMAFSQICEKTSYNKLNNMLHPKTESGFLKTTTAVRTECASVCERNSECKSFYHNPTNGDCFLASRHQTVVPDTIYSDVGQNRFDQFRRAVIESCEDVQIFGSIQVDGEFWLHPRILQGGKVKVYCSGMDTQTPEEYISLPNRNFGNFPPECNLNCVGESTVGCPDPGKVGFVEYTKIKVDIHTMVVDVQDKNYTYGNGTLLDYGSTGDCYNTIWDPPRCGGPKGKFKIDTTGTGLVFNADVQWKINGYMYKKVITWSDNGMVIEGLCGGWCGSCAPDQLKLGLNPADIVPDSSATLIRC